MKKKIVDLFKASSPSLIPELNGLFSDVFSLNEKEIIESIVQTDALKNQGPKRLNLLSFVKSKEILLPESFLRELNSKSLLSSLSTLNSSLKLENIHLLHKRMQVFIASFFREYDIPISVNMYVTPNEDVPCLAPHSDYTDVFIFQLSGAKKWTFFCDKSESFLLGDNEKSNEKTKLLNESIKKEYILNSGDVFHIPALVYHEASSLNGPSIHLTVSINRLRVEHIINTIECALLEIMNVSKFENLTNAEYESKFEEMIQLISSNKWEEIVKKKNDQLSFLSKAQIMCTGR